MRSVDLQKGRASARFPATVGFRGVLRVEAYLIETGPAPSVSTSVSVEFRRNDDLETSAKFNRDSYEPGQDVRLRLKARDQEGRPVQAELGVAAVDSAIEYRAERLGATSKPGPVALELTEAEQQVHTAVLMNSIDFDPMPWDFESKLPESVEARYAAPLRLALEPVVVALQAELKGNASPPPYLAAVYGILDQRNAAWQKFTDSWGNLQQLKFLIGRGEERVAATSAGPDESFHTADDTTIDLLQWPYFYHVRAAVEKALALAPRFPETDEQFYDATRAARIESDLLADPLGPAVPHVAPSRTARADSSLRRCLV